MTAKRGRAAGGKTKDSPTQALPLAKITRPALANVYARRRLFRWLDSTRGKHPVIWVWGPPGAGKTTLLASYLEARKLPALWYQIDEGDGDLASFFYYMGLAARESARQGER